MRINKIAIGLLVGFLSAPASAQTAIEQQRTDVISNVVQIQDELAARYDGRANVARIAQKGDHNAIEVRQSGLRNAAGIEMVGSLNGRRADGSAASVAQEGSLNFVSAEVLGDANFFNIGQSGVRNTAILTQTGGNEIHGANTAEIYQSNQLNVAAVAQTSIDAGLLSGRSDNFFSVSQDGYGNNAIGEQIGAANDGSIEQSGDGNSAVLGQYGGSNNSVIAQEGNGLVAQSLQFGNFTDAITIHQSAGAPPVSVTRGTP